ncbi:class I SAM-dependent methyltransferase [Mycolicibacterium celeriflavum]|uniref:class I SAM-dependent methyltransferase n=1 Tax=Mycolicibacterium celeriflavum TaxID=1249101 RepID=UPI003CEA2312
MENNGPSRTALVTAYARAYHQIADRPTIFADTLAASLLGTTANELAELSARPNDDLGAVVSDRARRLFFAARARFAEDSIARAVDSGTRQVVVLGAGLDTFGYRNPHPDVRVFEIDHPATQAWKRDRLSLADIDYPETLTFVPVDFEKQDLATELDAAGFTRTGPAIFVWLGVVFYLTPSAARATLEYIAGQTPPVEVVFDYLQPADTDEDRAHLQARAERLARAGEPFVSYLAPGEVIRNLRELGFTDIEDRAAQDVIEMYLGQAADFEAESARTVRASRILHARR